MPKVGMEPIRRRQLIEATLESIATHGMKATTINSISKNAGLSSGIISHYFGGKQGLIEATVRHLLNQLKQTLLDSMEDENISPQLRLEKIVETNFSSVHQSDTATKAWLSFWVQSMHDPELARLQRVNNRRLLSNLSYSFRQLMPEDKAREAAVMTAAMIDGFWLRAALSHQADDFAQAKQKCLCFVHNLIDD